MNFVLVNVGNDGKAVTKVDWKYYRGYSIECKTDGFHVHHGGRGGCISLKGKVTKCKSLVSAKRIISQVINAERLTTFMQAYVDCLLWSSTDLEGTPLDSIYSPGDISPEGMQEIRNDCKDFLRQAAKLIGTSSDELSQAGHDFALTRNRHGAGFWDRGLGDIGRKLTDISHGYGEFSIDQFLPERVDHDQN